jgi:hypothetical protein
LHELQGTLLIDPTAPTLELSAHYILLRGGTLRAGANMQQPHPGRFTITLWGDKETARRLPTFGAKVMENWDGDCSISVVKLAHIAECCNMQL